jgi:flagellar basal-body rod protein FlgC
MGLSKIFNIASAGLNAQTQRLRVIAENLANSETMGQTPGGLPYQRKTITFKNVFDRVLGVNLVKVARQGVDRAPFERRFDPSHMASDDEGYVRVPNVNPLIELTDMRQAQRTYEANLNIIEVTRSMLRSTIDILQ